MIACTEVFIVFFFGGGGDKWRGIGLREMTLSLSQNFPSWRAVLLTQVSVLKDCSSNVS